MKAQETILTAGAVLLLTAALATAATVDLHAWSPASYPAVSDFGAGSWNVAPNGASVTQTVNGPPTHPHRTFCLR